MFLWNSLVFLMIQPPCGAAGKESTRNAGDLGSIPGLGRSPGERKGYSLPVFNIIPQVVAKACLSVRESHTPFYNHHNLSYFLCSDSSPLLIPLSNPFVFHHHPLSQICDFHL